MYRSIAFRYFPLSRQLGPLKSAPQVKEFSHSNTYRSALVGSLLLYRPLSATIIHYLHPLHSRSPSIFTSPRFYLRILTPHQSTCLHLFKFTSISVEHYFLDITLHHSLSPLARGVCQILSSIHYSFSI